MTDLASPQWLATLDERLRGLPVDERRLDVLPVVVELHIEESTETLCWHLVVDVDGARVVPGAAETPTLTLRTDLATLAALRDGTTNAQRAVDAGTLRLRGDLNHLAAAGPALGALGAALHERPGPR